MDGLGSALNAQVRERVNADEELDVGPGLLVLAALEGDAALDQALVDDAVGTEPPPAAEADSVHVQVRRAYLDTISVSGIPRHRRRLQPAGYRGPRPHAGRGTQRQRQVELRRSVGAPAHRREPPLGGPIGRSGRQGGATCTGRDRWLFRQGLRSRAARQPVTVSREWAPGSDLSAGTASSGGAPRLGRGHQDVSPVSPLQRVGLDSRPPPGRPVRHDVGGVGARRTRARPPTVA